MADSETKERKFPKVSIIIPAYNEEGEIASAINEMSKQTYRNREIIVVDDGSTDQTFKRALESANDLSNARVIQAKHGGPSRARNVGARESSGDIVFFGECDCMYDSDYVEKAVDSLCKTPEAGAVCLTGGPLKLRSTLATNCIEIENVVQHRLLNEGKIKPFYAWVYRRDVFDKVGGFDEKLFQAEDKDLFSRVTKAGSSIAWIPGIHWRHKRAETTFELAQKWFRRGRTRVLFSLKHKLLRDLGRSLLPFWALVVGVIQLFFIWQIGLILIVAVLGTFLVQSIRIALISWNGVKRKRAFLGYPIFIVTRNFSTALGYSFGLVNVTIRRMQGKEISYRDV